MGDGEADVSEAGFGRSVKGDDFRGFVLQSAFTFDDLPFEGEIVFDETLRAIARDGAKILCRVNGNDDGSGRDADIVERTGVFEELFLFDGRGGFGFAVGFAKDQGVGFGTLGGLRTIGF